MKRTSLSRGTKTLKRIPFKAKSALRAKKRATGQNLPKKSKSKGKPSQAKLKKKLDAIFSQYIRRKYAGVEGLVKCYTCSTVKHWKEIQNGHWIPRHNLATRFSEDNCRPQCVACNMFQKGMPDVFAVNLIKEGIDIVALQQTRYYVFKIDSAWYEAQINKYTALLESL